MELLPSIIGAVTNSFLTNKSNENFLNFVKYIDKPDDCVTYINTVENSPVLNVALKDSEVISVPLEILYNCCPEFVNFYNDAAFSGIYNTEALTAFVVYFVLESYFDKEDGTEEKQSMGKLARILVKFMKFGNPKLDKLLSDLRKPEKADNIELDKTKVDNLIAKLTGEHTENTEKEDSKPLEQ